MQVADLPGQGRSPKAVQAAACWIPKAKPLGAQPSYSPSPRTGKGLGDRVLKAMQVADLLDSKTQATAQSMMSGRSGGQPPKSSAGGSLPGPGPGALAH